MFNTTEKYLGIVLILSLIMMTQFVDMFRLKSLMLVNIVFPEIIENEYFVNISLILNDH